MEERDTQVALNIGAADGLSLAKANLDTAYRSLLEMFDYASSEAIVLEGWQDEFERYCSSTLKFAYAVSNGGSMRPLVEATLLKRLVKERTALLNSLREEFLQGREKS